MNSAQKYLDAIAKDSFEVGLLDVRLLRGGKEVCTGQGQLAFTIKEGVDISVLSCQILPPFFAWGNGPDSGQLYDESHFWQLTAKTTDGWSVTVSRITSPNFEYFDCATAYKIKPDSVTLTREPEAASPSSVALLSGINEKNFPWNKPTSYNKEDVFGKSRGWCLDCFETTVDETAFRMKSVERDIAKLTFGPCTNFPTKDLLDAFCFSVSFLMGKSFRPIATLHTHNDVETLEIEQAKTRNQPYEFIPIGRYKGDPWNSECFLNRTISFLLGAEEKLSTAFRYSIFLMHYTRTVDISLKAMVLCSVLELLSNVMATRHPVVKVPFDDADYEALKQVIKEHHASAFPSIDLLRIVGLIGMLKQSRPQEILERMNPYFEVNKSEVEAWKNARNKVMHGEFVKWPDEKHYGLQDKVDSVHKVATLINRILLYLIGYTGIYTNYSERQYLDRYPCCSIEP